MYMDPHFVLQGTQTIFMTGYIAIILLSMILNHCLHTASIYTNMFTVLYSLISTHLLKHWHQPISNDYMLCQPMSYKYLATYEFLIH